VRVATLTATIAMFTAVACTPALAQDSTGPNTGGREYGTPEPAFQPTVPGAVAQLIDGIAHAPELAPPQVKQAIWAANAIVGKPYLYGGGHNRSFRSRGYDCSGTVSYALRGAGLVARPRDSSSLMRWGFRGPGQWITVYTNPGHAYVVIAGLRLDTSAADDPGGERGPRWRPLRRSNRGYRVRHARGL
jgi:cell wall-associated NlpC family hydrolase